MENAGLLQTDSTDAGTEALERQLEQLGAVYRLTGAVLRASALGEIYEEAIACLQRTLRADRASVLLFDPDGVMRFKAWRELSEPYRRRVEGHSPWSPSSRDVAPVLVPDVAREPALGELREAILGEGIRALAFVPLAYDGRLLGKFMVYYDAPHAFTAEEVQLARTIADHIAVAVDRKLAEEKLSLYREVFVNSADGIAIIDAAGRYLEQNDAHRALVGYPDAELRDRTPALHLGEERFAAIASELASRGSFRGEVRSRRRDGTTVDIDLSAFAVRDAAGEPVCYVGMKRDISDRKRAEAERARLLERERRSRAEAEAAEQRMAFLAEASAALAASLEYEVTLERVVRLAVPRLADRCFVDLLEDDGSLRRVAVAHAANAPTAAASGAPTAPPRWPDGVARCAAQVSARGEPEFVADVADAATGERTAALREQGVRSYVCAPLVARGRTLGAMTFALADASRQYTLADVALAVEVSLRAALAVDNARLYRAAQEANRLKDEFLGTVSHELRTPLNAVLGWNHMLRTGALNRRSRDRALETIERNARAQARLIDDLLDISRIVAGKLQLELSPVDPALAVEAAVESLRPAAVERGVAVECAAAPGGALVLGDASRLQQIVWNLLSNAVKFTPSGGQVRVALEQHAGRARIVVADTGEGIRPEFLPHVFDRFRQADSTTTRRHTGLGLGLAIVRHLVELHRGTVQARSDGEGRGATLVVELPLLDPAARSAEGRGARPAEPGPADLRNLRLLVVDDEPDARAMLEALLTRCGARVRAIGSAREALEALSSWPADVLISDIGMPEQDGYGLIRTVRALKLRRLRDIPAVALTAYARDEDQARALAAGFQAHVPKPIEPHELADVIAALATGATARRRTRRGARGAGPPPGPRESPPRRS